MFRTTSGGRLGADHPAGIGAERTPELFSIFRKERDPSAGFNVIGG